MPHLPIKLAKCDTGHPMIYYEYLSMMDGCPVCEHATIKIMTDEIEDEIIDLKGEVSYLESEIIDLKDEIGGLTGERSEVNLWLSQIPSPHSFPTFVEYLTAIEEWKEKQPQSNI